MSNLSKLIRLATLIIVWTLTAGAALIALVCMIQVVGLLVLAAIAGILGLRVLRRFTETGRPITVKVVRLLRLKLRRD